MKSILFFFNTQFWKKYNQIALTPSFRNTLVLYQSKVRFNPSSRLTSGLYQIVSNVLDISGQRRCGEPAVVGPGLIVKSFPVTITIFFLIFSLLFSGAQL